MPERREDKMFEECTAPEARDLPQELEDCFLCIMLVTKAGEGENCINLLFQHYLSLQTCRNWLEVVRQVHVNVTESKRQCLLDHLLPNCGQGNAREHNNGW